MKDETLLEQLDRSPVAYATLLAYITLAFLVAPDNPLHPGREGLITHGSAMGVLIPIEPWRLVTNAYLHGGFFHLLMNSVGLYFIGPYLEREIGSLRFLLLYLVTAICGSTAAIILGDAFSNLVGGSGALFGMLGCIVALSMRRGRNLLDFLNNPGSRRILLLIGANLFIGWAIPQISNSAHIGGLISGFVLSFCFLEQKRAASSVDRLSRVIQLGWIALFVSACLYVIVPVARGGTYDDIRLDSSNFPQDTRTLLTKKVGIPAKTAAKAVDYYGR